MAMDIGRVGHWNRFFSSAGGLTTPQMQIEGENPVVPATLTKHGDTRSIPFTEKSVRHGPISHAKYCASNKAANVGILLLSTRTFG